MNGPAAFPRVLVVGQPFTRSSGGGITLCNLFEGWPKDRLASIAASGRDVDRNVCEQTYVLGRDEITWAWPLSLVPRLETAVSGPLAPATPRAVGGTTGAPSSSSGLRRAFRSGMDALGVRDALRLGHVSGGLAAWVRDFAPDVVYSQLSDLPTMTLVREVLDATGAPFALHVMDDWPASMYRTGLFAPLVRRRAEVATEALFRRAAVRMAIGDAMAEEYLGRYGVPFTALQNSVDLPARDSLAALHRAEFERAEGSPLTVVYAGRVGQANSASLLDAARAVADLAAAGTPIVLKVYTGSSEHPSVAAMAGLRGVEVLPAVPYDRMPALLDAADVLLLPLDFDAASVRFARLSMPTKIPEYMAAARPVLTYAPRGCAAADYAREGGWSVLVDERDPAALRSALASLAADPPGRAAMGAAGRALAEARHDASAVRALFADRLTAAADGQRRT